MNVRLSFDVIFSESTAAARTRRERENKEALARASSIQSCRSDSMMMRLGPGELPSKGRSRSLSLHTCGACGAASRCAILFDVMRRERITILPCCILLQLSKRSMRSMRSGGDWTNKGASMLVLHILVYIYCRSEVSDLWRVSSARRRCRRRTCSLAHERADRLASSGTSVSCSSIALACFITLVSSFATTVSAVFYLSL